MKQQVEQLIDRLADKSLTFGCRVVPRTKDGAPWFTIREFSLVAIDDTQLILLPCGVGVDVNLESVDIKYCKEILGHPILIGDVLEKIEHLEYYNSQRIDEVISFWRQVGFTKSLQEIYSECEWIAEDPNDSLNVVAYLIIPKQKAHRELFLFLLSLNL